MWAHLPHHFLTINDPLKLDPLNDLRYTEFWLFLSFFHDTSRSQSNILKIGPNRPVQSVGLGIGDESSWINLSKPLMGQNRSKTEKIILNR